jgi:hypothetical protein
MFSPDVWGMKIRDVAYLHARSASAEARLLLGDRGAAREFADAELADARGCACPARSASRSEPPGGRTAGGRVSSCSRSR